MHAFALVQVTSVKLAALAPAGFGAATIDHRMPFHCSRRGALGPLLVPDAPTAKHVDRVAHARLESSPRSKTAGVWIGTMRHAVPSQRSAPSAGTYCVCRPTARHIVAEAHVTAVSPADGGPAGL